MLKSAALLVVASAFACGCASTELTRTSDASGTSGQQVASVKPAAYQYSPPHRVDSDSTLITLYAHDPVAKSFSVDDGKYGGIMRPSGVFNRDSDVTFGAYRPGFLSFAMQGRDEAHVINLGTSRELASRYGFDETVGGGQGFASIAFRDGEITIFEERHQSYQPLREADMLINAFDSEQNEVRAEVGHLYLVKLVDGDEAIFVKLMVVAMDPDSWIVLRWEKLDPNGVDVAAR